jgi:hypothetical protein
MPPSELENVTTNARAAIKPMNPPVLRHPTNHKLTASASKTNAHKLIEPNMTAAIQRSICSSACFQP